MWGEENFVDLFNWNCNMWVNVLFEAEYVLRVAGSVNGSYSPHVLRGAKFTGCRIKSGITRQTPRKTWG